MWRRHTYYRTAVALIGPPSKAHAPLMRADHMVPPESENGLEMQSLAGRHFPGTARHSGKGSMKLWGLAILPYTVSKAPTSYPCSPPRPCLTQPSPGYAPSTLVFSSHPKPILAFQLLCSLPSAWKVLFSELFFFWIVLFNSQVSVQIPPSPQGPRLSTQCRPLPRHQF